MPELYREFAAARLRHDDQVEALTLGAFQTIRVWVLTKNKKKMPRFSDLLPSKSPRTGVKSPEHARAALELLAARMGGKVRARSDVGRAEH